jgi:hypothetical protein
VEETRAWAILADGRVKPLQTHAKEPAVALTGRESLDGLSSLEILWGYALASQDFARRPYLRVYDPGLEKALGLPDSANPAAPEVYEGFARLAAAYAGGDAAAFRRESSPVCSAPSPPPCTPRSPLWRAGSSTWTSTPSGRRGSSLPGGLPGAPAAEPARLALELRDGLLPGGGRLPVPHTSWLSIHVMTIMLSYSAFALTMVLGHLVLFLEVSDRGSGSTLGILSRLLDKTLQAAVLFLAVVMTCYGVNFILASGLCTPSDSRRGGSSTRSSSPLSRSES